MLLRCLVLPHVYIAGEHLAAKPGIPKACVCLKRCSVSNLLAFGAGAELFQCLMMQATIASITAFQAAAGVTDDSLLNFVVSDGATLVATRFASENTQVGTSRLTQFMT